MEDIIGNMAYFTPAERQLTGYQGPTPIDEIDMTIHYDRLRDRRAYVQKRLVEVVDDYEQYAARQAELDQLEWDEAVLTDIEIDLMAQRRVMADALAGSQLGLDA